MRAAMERELETAAVVGPDGFIGRNLVDRLEAAGVAVSGVRKETPIRAVSDAPVDCVFFCAGNSAPHRTRDDPQFCLQRNVTELHEYLTELDYRTFVHFSSCAVYPPDSERKRPDATLDPGDISLYGAHKLLSERYVREFAERWIILRPAYLYGPGLWKNVIYDLRTGQERIFLDPDSELSILDVRHLADAAIALARSVENDVFNVASEYLVSVRELLEMAPGEYTFRDERYINHDGIALETLHDHWCEPLSRRQHERRIQAFLESGDVNREKGL